MKQNSYEVPCNWRLAADNTAISAFATRESGTFCTITSLSKFQMHTIYRMSVPGVAIYHSIERVRGKRAAEWWAYIRIWTYTNWVSHIDSTPQVYEIDLIKETCLGDTQVFKRTPEEQVAWLYHIHWIVIEQQSKVTEHFHSSLKVLKISYRKNSLPVISEILSVQFATHWWEYEFFSKLTSYSREKTYSCWRTNIDNRLNPAALM